MRKALYFQNTTNHDLEYDLIQKTVARESAFKRFKQIERAVKEKRRDFDDDSRLEMLVLLNLIRETTLDFMETVIQWQKMFVKAKRPTVMSEDYLIQMARSTEFVNASPLKKHYNFSVSRQNVFLLLMGTGKPKDPVPVTPRINEELQKLADPDMDRIINAYKLFKQTYPKKKFSALLTLNQWMKTLWMPNVKIIKPPRALTLPAMSATKGRSASPQKKPATSRRHGSPSQDAPVSLRSSTAIPTPTHRHSPDEKGRSNVPKPLTASPIRKGVVSTIPSQVSTSPQREKSAKQKSRKKPKKKSGPKTVPVTTGGSILDINNSQVEEPQSIGHFSQDSGSYISSVLDKKSPQREVRVKTPVSKQRNMKQNEKNDVPLSGVNEGDSTTSSLSSTKINTPQVAGRSKSPTRKHMMQRSRPRAAAADSLQSLSTMSSEQQAPMSTKQLREWFLVNGQQPVEMVEVIPAFPSKKK
mmetsp:Transcript_9087/g.15366  ORF Transcript_9087/g.15366 Transcript_9087/m.15366 type:complete len:470 (-) Transcript_9087:17-1426(-)